MHRKCIPYLFLLACCVITTEAWGRTAYTHSIYNENISINFGRASWDDKTANILFFSLKELLRLTGNDHFNLQIEHNSDQYINGYECDYKGRYRWALQYDPNNNQYSSEKPKPTIIIYGVGKISFEEYKTIAYYALTHLKEIASKQKEITLPYQCEPREKKAIAVADSNISIPSGTNKLVNDILGNKKVFIGRLDQSPEISYYYLQGKFVIFHLDKPLTKQNEHPYKSIEGKEILQVQNIYHIDSTPRDYLVFTFTHSFYQIDRSNMKVSGPYYKPELTKYADINSLRFLRRFGNGDKWACKKTNVKPRPEGYLMLLVVAINALAIIVSSRKRY